MTRYEHSGSAGGRHEGPRAAAFAMIRAWAAGLVVLLLIEYLQATLVYGHLVPDGGLDTFTSRLLLVHIPNAVCVALATWAAGRLHSEPYRLATLPHLMAACAVPVVAQALNLALQWHQLASEDLLI
jgi:hypothetical protein